MEQYLPSTILFPEQVLLGNPDIVKENLAKGRDASHLRYLTHGNPWALQIDHKNTEAQMLIRVSPGIDHLVLSMVSTAGPDFLPVKDKRVLLFYCS